MKTPKDDIEIFSTLENDKKYFSYRALSKISSVVSTGGQPDQICDAMKGSLVKKQASRSKKFNSLMLDLLLKVFS